MTGRVRTLAVTAALIAIAGCGFLLGDDPTSGAGAGTGVGPGGVDGGPGGNDTAADGAAALGCITPADCPPPSTPCVDRACTGTGKCAEIGKATSEPLPVPLQIGGFCYEKYCNEGKVVTRDAPSCGDAGTCKAGACSVPASCNGAEGAGNDCGSSLDTCCATIQVPGGEYKRRYDGVTYNDAKFPATVSPFKLDKYEVTIGRYRAFAAGGYGTKVKPPQVGQGAHPKMAGSGWLATWSKELPATTASLLQNLPEGPGRRPVVASWYSAFAFCIFDGGRLPTEAEWGFAASGGNQQRVYPWSAPPANTLITPSLATYKGNQTSEVGISTGVGRWGHFDLGGNASEWMMDRASDLSTLATCADCAFIAEGIDSAVIKGGDARSEPEGLRGGGADDRGRREWARDAPWGGFRCARDL